MEKYISRGLDKTMKAHEKLYHYIVAVNYSIKV